MVFESFLCIFAPNRTCQASSQCSNRRVFLFITMTKVIYPKSYSSPSDLVELLKSRGLSIEDESKAKSYLKNISYFRLSAYCHPLLEIPKENHQYKKGSTFLQILNLYRFDRKLRLLIFNEIEKIEVAIRSIIVNTACEHFGSVFWMTDANNFGNPYYFTKFIKDIKEDINGSSEDFICHFADKYNNEFPPAWAIAEILSLGGICHVYKNIKDQSLKKKISKEFGLQPAVFESWIMTLSGLRNICCHHGRLWNRTLKLKPIVPYSTKYPWVSDFYKSNIDSLAEDELPKVDIQRVYYRLCIIKYFLTSVSPNHTFKEKLLELLKKYPSVDVFAMGFTSNWQNEPIWR